MGLDLVKNKLRYNGRIIDSYPRAVSRDFCVPTLFFMYLNLLEGTLAYGSETEYWGTAFNFEPIRKNEDEPYYVMFCAGASKGKFMMFYKGEGGYIYCDY